MLFASIRGGLTLVLLFVYSAAAQAYDWNFFAQAKILGITQWQDNSPVYFRGGETYCFVPATEKNLIALIYVLYSTGRTADVHCYETAETVGGISGYRLHRVISN